MNKPLLLFVLGISLIGPALASIAILKPHSFIGQRLHGSVLDLNQWPPPCCEGPIRPIPTPTPRPKP